MDTLFYYPQQNIIKDFKNNKDILFFDNSGFYYFKKKKINVPNEDGFSVSKKIKLLKRRKVKDFIISIRKWGPIFSRDFDQLEFHELHLRELIGHLMYTIFILEKYKIPATIYMSTRFLEKNVSMWWYELKKLIESSKYLKFKYKNEDFNLVLKNKKQKENTFQKLRKLFLNLKTSEQLDLLEAITQTQKREDYSHSCLTPEELKILDKNSLITIGSHTHNHLNLKILDEKEITFEIKKSLEILEELLKHKIKHFSYPYGGVEEASTREYDLVKNLNISSAATSRAYPIKKLNHFSLPRIYIGNNTCEKSVINHLTGFYNLVYKFL